jgi:DNA-binding beta-propeller fold protein YncE
MNVRCLFKCLAPLGVGLFAAALWAGDVAISDGQNAEDVLGQTDGGGAGVFTQGTPYSSVALQGFNMPYGVDIDTVSHRLFVADRYSSRIMEYDLDSSNVLVDRTADHVLGQTNFYGNLYGTTKNTLSYPNNLDFDPASNRLFVADGLSPRVLIFDVASITDGENAVNELGQTNFTAATLATTINGLNYIYDVLFDAPTNRLFVSDYGNHRVMVYNLASISDGENAVNVLGQSDFTTGTSGLTQNKLSTPQEMSFDSASNRLFVAETGNRRVVVFDVASITDGENAINVLGQTTFTTNGTAVTQKGLTAPSGLAFDDGTQRLFVSDVSANRIVVYDVASITDGENAVNVLGQTSFTASGASVSQSGLLNPRGLAFDSGNNRLYNVDYLHCRVLSFDVASITNGENADNVIGQTDGMGGGVYTTQGVYDGAAQEGFNWPYAVEVDTVSHRLFVTDNATSRVLEYDLDASNTLVDRTFDHFLGQLENTRNLPTTTAYSTYNPAGLAFDPATNRLFVANYSSSRVTVFDVASITDGENAVNVLGQATMVSATRTASQSGMNLPGGLSFEPANSRLYVGDNLNHRVLVFDVASITDGENAIKVLGQSNFTTATSGTDQNTMNSPYFVNHDGGTRLFVDDRANHRVLVFDTTSITDGENAVSVLGQTNFTTATSGTTQSKFNLNYGLVSDRTGNRLFVSDFYNHRLLVFDTASITDGENAVNVIGQSNFTTGTYATAQNRLYYPQGITYEPAMNRLYVADRYNNRVLTYSAGPVAPSTSTLAASSGVEQVTLSWNSPGDDGVFNDLTGNYRIQYATYTLSWSTSSTPTNATTVTVATTSVAPGSAQSWTLGSLDGGVTYYFVLWTQDDANNWSGISNTTSAVPSAYAWFDTTQIEIDTVNGGLQNGSVVWGDFDNDGDSDILANGSDASYQLRVYKNNGNGTFNPLQSEVDGANGGIQSGGAVAGDFDNDGDLDVLVVGANSSTSQLRVYRGNGNATFDGAQIEVDGLNGGLTSSSVAWGDYDNDGDLDILTAGSGGGYQLRVYKNNGNGTFDPNQLDLDGVGYGVYQCGTAWGDFDNDGDLDILAGGYDVNSYQLRIYKNNGNGTLNSTQIDVDGSGGGLQQCGVAWGDFDNDGDLDILGVGDNGAKQLRVYKNNGNGTIDATQIEVDGSGGGLTTASAAWGDFDNDGDLDILENGTDGTNRQLRVYKNNGTASFSPNQIEVDGLNGGLSAGGAAWGDFDIDGDLDILTSGTDGTNRQLRVYKNQSAVANTAPSAPTTLTAAWAFNASGISTATFKWNPAVDNGATATPANVLTYQVEISSSSGFTGKSVVADPHGSSPGMGNYLKPPLMFDGLTTHGVMLYSLPLTNTTFYYRVKTIDAGLKESAWSSTGSLYTAVPSSAPSAVVDLAAGQLGDGQITLQWTEPLNINSGANAQYDVRFSTTAPIANDTDFNNATSLSGEPAPGLPGTRVSMGLLNLTPMVTYYFGLKASNDNGTSALDVVTPRPSAVASPFDATQIEVDGIRGGLHQGGAAWGDFDNDGDLDVLASGYDASTRQFRVYKSNGNGTIDPVQIEVESLNNGFNLSGVAWGDFDNDGDLDILVNGDDAAGRQLRVYRNNGNGTINATQIEVESLNGGLNEGGVAWGDFDNDGDLDVLADGYDGANSQLRVYKNNGNGTLDVVQIEVDGLNNGLRVATVAWGDFDKDGDLDILANGSTGPNQLRVYKNLGDGTIDATQIEVDGLNGGIQAGGSTWGDFDNDGDMDILIAGWDGSNSQLRVYKNNGNGTIDTAQIEVDGVNNGLRYSSSVASFTWAAGTMTAGRGQRRKTG